MDAHLETFLDARQAYAGEKDSYKSFKNALAEGDVEAAQAAREKVLENLAAPMRLQLDLMITATGELTAEQRKRIAEEYPMLFTRPWVRMAMSKAGGRPGVGRPGNKARGKGDG
jgi:hypothetical protein